MKMFPLYCSLLLSPLLLVGDESRTLTAYLVDQKCFSYYRDTQPEKLQDHSRACALACGRESGYGIIAADEYILLDPEERKLAQTWLESTSMEKDLRVKVTVVREGGKSRVVKIE